MTDLQQRLDTLIASAQQKLLVNNQILPQKTAEGILVGNVLIVSEESYKHLFQHGRFVYENIYLNAAAIKMANLLAKNVNRIKTDNIYNADQNYGRWFVDSQILRNRYEKSVKNKEYDKADILWSRYVESRNRAVAAKNFTYTLTDF